MRRSETRRLMAEIARWQDCEECGKNPRRCDCDWRNPDEAHDRRKGA